MTVLLYNCWQFSSVQCAVKLLSGEPIKVSKTRYSTVKILSANFAVASKKSGKNPCHLLKTDITSAIDADENEYTSRRYTVVFFVLVM